MTGKLFVVVLAVAALAVAVLGAVSYRDPLVWEASPTGRTWLQVVFRDGNCRVVSVYATDPDPTMDHYALFWRLHPAAGRFRIKHFTVDAPGGNAVTHEFQLDLAGWLPGAALIFLVAIGSAKRRLGLELRPAWHEMWTTTGVGMPWGRRVRRTGIAGLVGLSLASAALWLWSFMSEPLAWGFGPDPDFGVSLQSGTNPTRLRAAAQSIGADRLILDLAGTHVQVPGFGESGPYFSAFVRIEHGKLKIGRALTQGQTAGVFPKDAKFAGFGLLTGLGAQTVYAPLWAPVVLFLLYPVIAFFRGPVRRCHRRAKGFCPCCAYDLTGLPEPRCPECGTPI
jgi:hypothetical protein